jgi:lysozyme
MTEADRLRLRARVKTAEGFRSQLYRDSEGYLTIGYGRLLEPSKGGGISKDEAEYLLSNDLRRAEREAESLEPYLELAPARQAVLAEMVFNMGLGEVKAFKRMLSALVQQDFALAAFEMQSSRWAGQVGVRAVQLAEQMKTGQWAS